MSLQEIRQTSFDIESLAELAPVDPNRIKAEDALLSHLIVGFEEALGGGVSPMEALGQVLHWVASEMYRIQTITPLHEDNTF